ncbi:Fmp52p [Sporobolomyces salmoneus]|uniref:Fmp52p n=1 Tax=Sporobolomyces salmoneus TaxID=183962 RepID=UPI0031715304
MSTKVILLGSTGATGKESLSAALSSPSVSSVFSFGRRSPPVDNLADANKLIHKELDYEKLLLEKGTPEYENEAKKLKEADADAVLITLGTTRKTAGSAEAFEKIDREYVVKAAEAARIEGKTQKLIYLSSASSNSASSFLYVRSKGLTEEALASLGYSETIIARPGYLDVPGGRGESRILETGFGKVMGLLSTFSDRVKIGTPVLGKALVNAAITTGSLVPKWSHQESLRGASIVSINNAQLIKLGKATEEDIKKA